MKKISLLFFAALLIVSLTSTPVHAEEDELMMEDQPVTEITKKPLPPNKRMMPPRDVTMKEGEQPYRINKENFQEFQEKVKEEKQEFIEKNGDKMRMMKEATGGAMKRQPNCEEVTKRIEEVTARYDKNHQGQVLKYEKLLERLNKTITSLTEKGYDTTEVSATVPDLEKKLKKLSDDYAVFIKNLEASKEFTCGESEGDFKAVMLDARESLLVVREDILDIREYYNEVIRPALRKLKEQKVEVAPTGSAEQETESSETVTQ